MWHLDVSHNVKTCMWQQSFIKSWSRKHSIVLRMSTIQTRMCLPPSTLLSLESIKFRKLDITFCNTVLFWSSSFMSNFQYKFGLNLHRVYNSEQRLLWVGALQRCNSMHPYNYTMPWPLTLPFLGSISSHRQVKCAHWELILLRRVGCNWAYQCWASCKFSLVVIINGVVTDQTIGNSILTELVILEHILLLGSVPVCWLQVRATLLSLSK